MIRRNQGRNGLKTTISSLILTVYETTSKQLLGTENDKENNLARNIVACMGFFVLLSVSNFGFLI